MPAPKQQRTYNFASAGKRAVEHADSSGGQCLKLPDGFEWFPVKPGTYMLDFLPYEVKRGNAHAQPGELAYERTYFRHQNIANGDKRASVVCLHAEWAEKCPICLDLRERGMTPKEERSKEDQKILDDHRNKERQIFCVVNAEDPKRVKRIMEHSYHLFGKKLDAFIRSARRIKPGSTVGMYDQFYHPETGYTVRVTFEEKALGSGKCVEATSLEMLPREKKYPMSVIDSVPCLDELLVRKSYADIHKMYFLEDLNESEELPPEDETYPEDIPSEELPEEVEEEVAETVEEEVYEEPAEETEYAEQAEDEVAPEEEGYEEVTEPEVGEGEEAPAEEQPEEVVDEVEPEEDLTYGFVAGNRVTYDRKDANRAGEILSINQESGVATIKEDGEVRKQFVECYQLTAEPEKKKPAPKPAPAKAPAKPAAPAAKAPAAKAPAKPATPTRPPAKPAAPAAKPATGAKPLPANRPPQRPAPKR